MENLHLNISNFAILFGILVVALVIRFICFHRRWKKTDRKEEFEQWVILRYTAFDIILIACTVIMFIVGAIVFIFS